MASAMTIRLFMNIFYTPFILEDGSRRCLEEGSRRLLEEGSRTTFLEARADSRMVRDDGDTDTLTNISNN